jgi:hypothetical protein
VGADAGFAQRGVDVVEQYVTARAVHRRLERGAERDRLAG